MADDFIVDQIDQLGLGVPIRCITPSEVVDLEFSRVVGIRTIGAFAIPPLNADHRGDADAGSELADVHFDHIGCLVQDHLRDQLVAAASGLRQILPADDKAPAREFTQGRGANLSAIVADVAVRRHDGIRRERRSAEVLVGVIVVAGQSDIERHKPLSAHLQVEEVRVEEAESKWKADAIREAIGRCRQHVARPRR